MARLGGWRLNTPFGRGNIAINFDTMQLYMSGGGAGFVIQVFDLPAMGAGSDINTWPIVSASSTISYALSDYVNGMYCNGLVWWRSKLWLTLRVFYAQVPYILPYVRLYATDGEIIQIDGLFTQRFSGFVKRGPGLDPYVGGGGYVSGQGSCSGPTLASLDGTIRIGYQFPALPGANLEYWDLRAPRDTNYSTEVGVGDSWVCWEPRVVNGSLQGRWASDAIAGGGLVLDTGITYWPILGIGELKYSTQDLCFAQPGMVRNYEYRYDATTFQLLSYAARPDLDTGFNGIVTGQELGPDGKIYLCQVNQWAGSSACPALSVFDSSTIPPPAPPPVGISTSWMYNRQLQGRR